MNKRSTISAGIPIFVGEGSPAYFSLELRPPVCSLSGWVPPRNLFGAVPDYYRRSLHYSIVPKLFLGRSPRHAPAFQRSLWKCVPSVSSLSGSVPSRNLFGAVPNYYRRSLHYSIVSKLFLGRSLRHAPAFQRSLWKCVPPVSSLLGSVPSRNIFGAVPTYFRRSRQYIFSKAIVETISIPCATSHEFSRGLVITELSLRPFVDCCFCNSLDAHAGCVRGRRGARSPQQGTST